MDLTMTPGAYRALRERLGSQEAVARHLAVSVATVSRRERGETPLDTEAALALRMLAYLLAPEGETREA